MGIKKQLRKRTKKQNETKKPLIIEFIGPSRCGKTTLANKLEKEKRVYRTPNYKKTKKDFFKKITNLPKLIVFAFKNFDLVKEIYKQSSKKRYFFYNYRKIAGILFISIEEYKKAKKKKHKIIIRDEPNINFLMTRKIVGTIKNTDNIINLYNKKYYSKHKVLVIYKDVDTEKIIERKNKNKKKTKKELEEFKKITKEYKKEIKKEIKKLDINKYEEILNEPKNELKIAKEKIERFEEKQINK